MKKNRKLCRYERKQKAKRERARRVWMAHYEGTLKALGCPSMSEPTAEEVKEWQEFADALVPALVAGVEAFMGVFAREAGKHLPVDWPEEIETGKVGRDDDKSEELSSGL